MWGIFISDVSTGFESLPRVWWRQQQRLQQRLRPAPSAPKQMSGCLSPFPELQRSAVTTAAGKSFPAPMTFTTCVRWCFFRPVAAVVSWVAASCRVRGRSSSLLGGSQWCSHTPCSKIALSRSTWSRMAGGVSTRYMIMRLVKWGCWARWPAMLWPSTPRSQCLWHGGLLMLKKVQHLYLPLCFAACKVVDQSCHLPSCLKHVDW